MELNDEISEITQCVNIANSIVNEIKADQSKIKILINKINQSIDSVTYNIGNPMTLTKDKRKALEKFYTKDKVVELCMQHLTPILKKMDNPHILEPSAGGGGFINKFDPYTYTAYDIQPEGKNIIKADFLSIKSSDIISKKFKADPLVTIGNPPYKLAIDFINKCAGLKSCVIAFVLPNVFKKPTKINKINRKYHLFKQIPLPKRSFELGDDDYDVPSSFFIFVRKKALRPLINLEKTCKGYVYVSYSKLILSSDPKKCIITGADLSIIRVGGRAGMAFLTTDISEDALVSKKKYNYFIKFDSKPSNIDKIIKAINAIEWEKHNTTGPRSIGKYELTPILNKIVNC
jgi:hypothetical protein